MQEGSLLTKPSPACVVCGFFDEGLSDRCEVLSPCSFDLHFSLAGKSLNFIEKKTLQIDKMGTVTCGP